MTFPDFPAHPEEQAIRDLCDRTVADFSRFLLCATPDEVADLSALLPVILGRRARLAEQHAAAQREAPTTRQAAADGALAALLRGLGGGGEKSG